MGFTKGVGKADNWASVPGTSLAIIGGIIAVVTALRRRRAVAAAPITPEQLVQAGTVLARIVVELWRREAEAGATVAGGYVVLFEDLLVSEAAAGAAAVMVVCLARWLEESKGYPARTRPSARPRA